MPTCTVRYHVRLLPKATDAQAMDAIGIFTEERSPDGRGEPGPLLSRRLDRFSGPAGEAIREMVTHGDAWHMDVQDRVGPLEWDDSGGSGETAGAGTGQPRPKDAARRRRWLS